MNAIQSTYKKQLKFQRTTLQEVEASKPTETVTTDTEKVPTAEPEVQDVADEVIGDISWEECNCPEHSEPPELPGE